MTYMTKKLIKYPDYDCFSYRYNVSDRFEDTEFETLAEAEKEALKVADKKQEDVNIYQVVSVAKFPRVSATIVAAT